MTPGNNGASTPEGDDPFGYLYADGQAAGATPPSGGGGYGYPGPRSMNQVRTVGERQYGQAPRQPAAPPQQPYGQQQPPYGAQQQPQYSGGDDGGRGRGPNTRGLLIGAIAVAAAVVVVIAVVVLGGDSDEKAGDNAGGDSSASSGTTSGQSEQPADEKPDKGENQVKLPKGEAKALKLEGGAAVASDIEGAKSAGGYYVAGFNQVGAKLTWTFPMEKAGDYRLNLSFNIPEKDADATLVVNGKPNTNPLGMKNFGGVSKEQLPKSWQTTWAPVTLTEGTNTIELVCADGNQCDVNIDQLDIGPVTD